MSKLKIYTFPDDILAKKALPIERVEKDLRRFADDMLETMYEAPGVGLAANQVGVLKRILVIDTDFTVLDEDENHPKELVAQAEVIGSDRILGKNPRIIINPEIIFKAGEILFDEGCLSVPEFTAEIRRAEKIKVKYTNIDGLEKTLSAEGFLAVAIQHEMDHLDGKLFIDRISPLKRQMIKKKLVKRKMQFDNFE